jgi:hypothetical protein
MAVDADAQLRELRSMGQGWTQSPIRETLYLGRVDFYDRSVAV